LALVTQTDYRLAWCGPHHLAPRLWITGRLTLSLAEEELAALAIMTPLIEIVHQLVRYAE
jgi:hypothetical protein